MGALVSGEALDAFDSMRFTTSRGFLMFTIVAEYPSVVLTSTDPIPKILAGNGITPTTLAMLDLSIDFDCLSANPTLIFTVLVSTAYDCVQYTTTSFQMAMDMRPRNMNPRSIMVPYCSVAGRGTRYTSPTENRSNAAASIPALKAAGMRVGFTTNGVSEGNERSTTETF